MRDASWHYDLSHRQGRQVSTVALEALFFDVIELLQPSLFIEAGAKDAGTSRRARGHLPDASIVAFEANPYTHKRFDEKHDNASLRVQYRHAALSLKPGIVTINVRRSSDGRPASDGQASLLKRDDYVPGHVRELVEATTLDSVFDEFGAESCALWVDVEGALQAVFGGGRTTLQSACAVFVEVEDREFWKEQWLDVDVATHLYDRGLIPVARDFQSRHQYNILFLPLDVIGKLAISKLLACHEQADSEGPTGWFVEAHHSWLRGLYQRMLRLA